MNENYIRLQLIRWNGLYPQRNDQSLIWFTFLFNHVHYTCCIFAFSLSFSLPLFLFLFVLFYSLHEENAMGTELQKWQTYFVAGNSNSLVCRTQVLLSLKAGALYPYILSLNALFLPFTHFFLGSAFSTCSIYTMLFYLQPHINCILYLNTYDKHRERRLTIHLIINKYI